MRNPLLVLVYLCTTAVLASPAGLRAEVRLGESLEWVVADSDHVFMGKVVKVDQKVGKDKRLYEVATAEVFRTFKGKHVPQATFVQPCSCFKAAKGWLDDGGPLLFCLVCRENVKDGKDLPEGFDWVVRESRNELSAVLLGKTDRRDTDTIGAFSMDFDVLEEPAAILEFVEACAP